MRRKLIGVIAGIVAAVVIAGVLSSYAFYESPITPQQAKKTIVRGAEEIPKEIPSSTKQLEKEAGYGMLNNSQGAYSQP